MNVTWQSYRRNHPDKDTKAFWFGKLDKFDLTTVETAFDKWISSQGDLPVINEIIKLCQPQVTIFARLPSPLAIAENKRHAEEVVQAVNEMVKPKKKDYKDWAKRIIANPSAYPDTSFKLAQEALNQVPVKEAA
jgi:hypothetical protein